MVIDLFSDSITVTRSMVAQRAALKQTQTSNSDLWGRGHSDGARVLQETLNYLEPGITIFDARLQLIFANRRFLELRDIPDELGRVGTTFVEQVRFRAERGDYGAGDVEEIVKDHVELARQFESHCVERVCADGTVLEIRGNPFPGGGFIAVYSCPKAVGSGWSIRSADVSQVPTGAPRSPWSARRHR